MNRLFGIALALGVLTLTTVGCGGGSSFPDPVPVTGVVKLNGSPVDGATVTFMTKDGAGRSASGQTDGEGNFTLGTFSGDDGAIPGEYTVTITKSDSSSTDTIDLDGEGDPGEAYEAAMEAAGSAAEAGKVDTSLPAKYAKAEESGLNRSVGAEGKNHFEFDLK